MVEQTTAWIEKRYDIGPETVGKLMSGELEPGKRHEWTQWMPSGVLQEWASYSQRERVLMVAVGFHMSWKVQR